MSVTIQMDSIGEALELTPAERKKKVTSISLQTGLEAALKVSLFSVPTILALTKYYKPFTRSVGVSGRTALAITPPLFAFGLVSEQVASRLATPDSYESYVRAERQSSTIALHHQVANYIYFHPFKVIFGLGVPTVAGIFMIKGGESDGHLKFSQRIMHTRVIGQASILTILAGTMAFYDYMDKRGPYTS